MRARVYAVLACLLVAPLALAQEPPKHVVSVQDVLAELSKGFTSGFWGKVWVYFVAPALIVLIAVFLRRAAARRIQNEDELYSVRKLIVRVAAALLIVYFGFVILAGAGAGNVATIIGLLGAGLTVALQDIIASFFAWFFIVGSRGFRIGDRIRIGDLKGDVVDIGILRSTVMAVQNIRDVEGQAIGSLRVFPNNLIFKFPLENYTIGNEYVWNEIDYLVTYESDWQKAERMLLSATEVIGTEHIANEARKKMQHMRRDFRVRVGALTPIVYVKAADSGVLLTLRYLCDIRQVRGTSDRITREVMMRFSETPDVNFAYPTRRVIPTPPQAREEKGNPPAGVF
ncbi:MAG: mechanosensitive ion channel domain-containing protein [Planctomycetota bacterium]